MESSLRIIMAATMLMFCFLSMNKIEATTPKPIKSKANTNTVNKMNEGKTLIVYFSKTGQNYPDLNLKIGNTAVIANYIQQYTGGTLFEIVPAKPYPNNYIKCTEVAKEEKNSNARPEMKNELKDLDKYDIIFLGTPIWWSTFPMVYQTFFDKYNLNGKILIPFCTHEGSGMGTTVSDLKKRFPKAEVRQGIAIQGIRVSNAQSEINNWLDNLGLKKK